MNIYFNAATLIGIGTVILSFAIGSNVKWIMSIRKLLIKESHILAIKEHEKFGSKNKKYRQ